MANDYKKLSNEWGSKSRKWQAREKRGQLRKPTKEDLADAEASPEPKMREGTYTHKKTGKLYVTQRVGVINATNAQDGQKMVIYRAFGVTSLADHWYVREEAEFMAKFEFVE